LPDPEATPACKRFQAYPIGFVHIDLAEVRTGQSKAHLFVVIKPMASYGCTASPRAGSLLAACA
jgi:hypothetical protein